MKVGSLFAGIGGTDLGFHQAGFEIVWANELDKDACKTYRLNFPDTKLFECDIRKLDVSLLSKVDIITAGFPCQPFSICGNQKGFSDRGYYLRYLVADACDYGIPQHRTRTYILAFRDVERCESYRFPEMVKLEKRVFDIIDKSVKADDSFYLPENSPKHNKMAKAITDDNQIYRFSDYGIQKSNKG